MRIGRLSTTIFTATSLFQIPAIVYPEEHSILDSAIVNQDYIHQTRTPDGSVLIHGSYKSYVFSADMSTPIYFEIEFAGATNFITVFVLNSTRI